MIAVIFGTRPEIIKLTPIVRALEDSKSLFFIIHTNQHYSKNLDAIFLEELGLPQAKYSLEIGSGTHGEMTGKMLIAIEKVLMEETPDIVVVEGDTNTVLAGALAATKLHVKVAHGGGFAQLVSPNARGNKSNTCGQYLRLLVCPNE